MERRGGKGDGMEVFEVVKVMHKADAEPIFTPCHRTGSGLLEEVMKWVKPEKRKYLCRCQSVGEWLLLPWEAVEVVAKYKWAISWPADAEINTKGRRPGCSCQHCKAAAHRKGCRERPGTLVLPNNGGADAGLGAVGYQWSLCLGDLSFFNHCGEHGYGRDGFPKLRC